MARIDLEWGGGGFSVILNLKDGQLFPYGGKPEFHQEFGGKCYYTSRSGMSGAGWIPGSPYFRRVQGYRTDTQRPDWPQGCETRATVGGKSVAASGRSR